MDTEPGIPIFPESSILILDDDEDLRIRLELLFAKVGLDNVIATADEDLASSLVAGHKIGLIFLGLYRPEEGGDLPLQRFAQMAPETPIIVLTSSSDPSTIIKVLMMGASDYVLKPIDEVRLMVTVWNILATLELRREAEHFRDGVLVRGPTRPAAFEAIVTKSDRMLALFTYAESVARSRQPVLITGETGTGKELFARAIHEASGRKGPFVAVNVGGLDDTMFSDSLFGHRKGAFTGADSSRAGMLKEATGGTILLDEIGDLEPHSQIKLLRLLQENEYYPLGSDSPSRSDARVIAATTKDLRALAATGAYRSDLFYRLQTHPIYIPPLRDRPCDLQPLIRLFLEKSARELGQAVPGDRETAACAEKLLRILSGYPFPGNIRELESLVHDAVTGARGGKLDLEALKARIGQVPAPEEIDTKLVDTQELSLLAKLLADGHIPTLEEAEQELIKLAVERAAGNLSQASLSLGISRQTLYNKLKERRPN
jgi:two-component system, NtrC family, nitrogen regulation response regulator GlnG